MKIDSKEFFSQLDEETIKKASKKEKPEKDISNDGKVAKKILSGIKSPALRDQFKKQKVLIDNKKFWTKD